MVAGCEMEDAVRVAGTTSRWNFDAHERFVDHYGLLLQNSYVTEGYGSRCLGALMKKHDVLVCCWSSCLDPQYAHDTVVFDGHNYDPWRGMDPQYPWDKYVSRAKVYVKSEG
jgi:hypothetical protein